MPSNECGVSNIGCLPHVYSPKDKRKTENVSHSLFSTIHFLAATLFKADYSLQCTWELGLSGSPTHFFGKKKPTHPQCSTALRNPYQMRGTPHGNDKCQTIPQGTLITNMVSHTEVAGECPTQVFCTAKWQHSFQQRTILGCCILRNSECSFPKMQWGLAMHVFQWVTIGLGQTRQSYKAWHIAE